MSRDFRTFDFDQPLPENPDAERFVLGAVLSNQSGFELVVGLLKADDFSIEKHQRIFASMVDLHERGEHIDRITLYEELNRKGQVQSVDGLSYLVSLDDGLPQLHNLESYCRIVREKSILRHAIGAAYSLISQCMGSENAPTELLVGAERVTEILNTSRQSLGMRTVETVISDEGGINEFLLPERTPGIPVPFPDLNGTISGLRRSKLVVIGARPAVGKTALATQIAEHAAANGHRVLLHKR